MTRLSTLAPAASSPKEPRVARRTLYRSLAGAWICLQVAAPSDAFVLDTGDSDVKIRWDNTLKYSSAWRLKSPVSALISSPNYDDGDRNFRRGLISSRMDLLSEFDASYRAFGFRISGAGWYDSVYNRRNGNDSPSTVNQPSGAYNQFTTAARDLHGRKGELLDAFVYGKADIGEQSLSWRIGRHSVLWGESLFFGANGIAAGQAAIDTVKSQSVPNTQFKELIRPTPQISGQLQITPNLAVGTYYQWRWEKNRLPAAGSYFSTSDTAGDGTQRQLYFGPYAATKAPDIDARNSGQGGVQLRLRLEDTDIGLYAIQYHDRSPQLYFRGLLAATPPGVDLPAQYLYAYPQKIRAFGASFSRTVGVMNIAGEASIRHNAPLASDAQLDLSGTANNAWNPLYAVGKTAHAQLSTLTSLPPNFIAREMNVSAEIAWNRTLSVRRNASALNPNADRDATNFRVTAEPMYRQVLPGLDISVPVGLGYGIGNSSAVGSAFLGNKVGDFSIGLSGAYLDVWRFTLNYTHYFGPAGTFIDANNHTSFKQSLQDRDFISLSVQRTF